MSVLADAIVLIVDDDHEYREIHSRLLKDKVHRLFVVDSRHAAMDLLRRQFFHAALLDIRLVDAQEENVEGLELAKAIYDRRESTGIVIISGYGTTERSRTAFRQYKAVDFLEKATYTPDQFFEAVRDAVTDSVAYVAQARWEATSQSLLERATLDAIKKNLNYIQQGSFDKVFQNLVSPLAPLVVAKTSVQILDGAILEIRCWSRFNSSGYVVRIGPRRQISDDLDRWRQAGRHEEDRYTVGFVSGFRYSDSELSPEDLS